MENLTGYTIDISEYLDFYFYDPVYYWDILSGEKGEAFPGIWLDISHRVDAFMCYWVLNEQWNVISRSTLQSVTNEDLLNPTLKGEMELAYKNMKEKLADEKHKLEPCP